MNDFLNHWFSKIKISYSKKKRLMDKYLSLEKVWNLNVDQLKSDNSFLTVEDIYSIAISKNCEQLIKEVDELKRNHICSINIFDNRYPQKLKVIKDYPLVLFYIGNLELSQQDIVGVVGTRLPTQYGKKTSMDIAFYLSNNHIIVISGMAYGIDTCAHIGAIKGKCQKTIAVLGNGLLDTDIYPKSNLQLLKSIVQNGGLVISEYPIYTKASKEFFPARNRIIAALSDKLIVVEAGMKSGSFITVDYALDYGKDVYAVPGGIYSEKSIGCNQLIKEGANMFCDFKDIL